MRAPVYHTREYLLSRTRSSRNNHPVQVCNLFESAPSRVSGRLDALRRRRARRRRRNVMVLPWIPPIRVQLTPPSEALLTFAVACAGAPFSAHPPGLIDSPPPLWYVNDHEEAVGQGRAEFVRAGDALRRLDCLQLDWLRATVQGDVLAICSRQFGVLWLMNANRLLPKAARAASGTDCVAMSWGTTARHVREPRAPHAPSRARPSCAPADRALSLAGAGGRGAALRALGSRDRHRALSRALVLAPPPRLRAARLSGRAAAAAALREGRGASHAAGLHGEVRLYCPLREVNSWHVAHRWVARVLCASDVPAR